jgi:peptide-methionine (S)-S-oxide reductase
MSVNKLNLLNPFMRRFFLLVFAPAALLYAAIRLVSASTVATSPAVTPFPDPAIQSISAVPSTQKQTAVFAGGCFWGMEGVFEHLKGVSEVVTGYTGGNAASAHYEDVSTGTTSHAESVKITYDPAQITYAQILKVYFAVAHDPTQLNQQGPDRGTQYRSAIFFANDEQAKIAQTYIDQLNQTKVFNHPIVTQLNPLGQFYAAEDYHQDFIKHHPDNLYVVLHDLPQIAQLQKQFPELYRE